MQILHWKKKKLITAHHLESFDLRNYWLIFRLKFRWHKKMWKKIYVTLKTYLCHLQKLPGKFKKMFADFETLMDPSRNHRVYRLSVSKLTPPIIPFMPLLMKGSYPLCVLTKTDLSINFNWTCDFLSSSLLWRLKKKKIISTLDILRKKNKY